MCNYTVAIRGPSDGYGTRRSDFPLDLLPMPLPLHSNPMPTLGCYAPVNFSLRENLIFIIHHCHVVLR